MMMFTKTLEVLKTFSIQDCFQIIFVENLVKTEKHNMKSDCFKITENATC